MKSKYVSKHAILSSVSYMKINKTHLIQNILNAKANSDLSPVKLIGVVYC
jgi:hypothetical protein